MRSHFKQCPALRFIGIFLLLLPLISCGESTQQSDERVLRQTFQIPKQSTLASIFSDPTGWGPRENLRIHATFQFSEADFAVYRSEQGDRWTALPISEQLLGKIMGDAQVAQYQQQLTAPPSQENPQPSDRNSFSKTAELDRWQQWLFGDVEIGVYQCLTAGDNILFEYKRPCLSENRELRDFMIAVLDDQNRTLNITVRTGY